MFNTLRVDVGRGRVESQSDQKRADNFMPLLARFCQSPPAGSQLDGPVGLSVQQPLLCQAGDNSIGGYVADTEVFRKFDQPALRFRRDELSYSFHVVFRSFSGMVFASPLVSSRF